MATGSSLGAERVVFTLWSRDLSSVEERRSGLDLARMADLSRGAKVDLTCNVGDRHRWIAGAHAERLTHQWQGTSDRKGWRTGIWFGSETKAWGGTARAGVRGEYHQEWGRQPLGELGDEIRLGLLLDACLRPDVEQSLLEPDERHPKLLGPAP